MNTDGVPFLRDVTNSVFSLSCSLSVLMVSNFCALSCVCVCVLSVAVREGRVNKRCLACHAYLWRENCAVVLGWVVNFSLSEFFANDFALIGQSIQSIFSLCFLHAVSGQHIGHALKIHGA